MEWGFHSVLGKWGIFVHNDRRGVELSCNCIGSPANLDKDGKCYDCRDQVPEEVAQAALLIPGFSHEQYPSLYGEDK